jgi:hypothetical protein
VNEELTPSLIEVMQLPSPRNVAYQTAERSKTSKHGDFRSWLFVDDDRMSQCINWVKLHVGLCIVGRRRGFDFDSPVRTKQSKSQLARISFEEQAMEVHSERK